MPYGTVLLDALDRVGFGGIVVDTAGHVLLANAAAMTILRRYEPPLSDDGRLEQIREATKVMLRSSGSKRFRMNDESWAVIPGDTPDARGVVVHAMPISPPPPTGAHTVLVLINLDYKAAPSGEVLKNLFDLSPAEARVAHQLARGRSLEEIAELSGVKLSTIRKQLASVFEKTMTNRQGELVALLGRLTILP